MTDQIGTRPAQGVVAFWACCAAFIGGPVVLFTIWWAA